MPKPRDHHLAASVSKAELFPPNPPPPFLSLRKSLHLQKLRALSRGSLSPLDGDPPPAGPLSSGDGDLHPLVFFPGQ